MLAQLLLQIGRLVGPPGEPGHRPPHPGPGGPFGPPDGLGHRPPLVLDGIGDGGPQYFLCIAVWCLALLLVRSSFRVNGGGSRHRLLLAGITAGLAREVVSLGLELLGPRPLREHLWVPGVLPLFEAWVQGVGILILIGGFLAYFADEVSVGPRYLRWTLAIQVGAFAAILGLFLAMREPMIFGAPRHLLVAGGVGIGFVLMAAGVIFTLRYVRKDPDRWLMAIGISFFLAGILVRGLAYFNSSFAIRPPMDVPYAVTASAIGVVLLGYLFVRTHAAEVRADLNVLEDQVRERTAHLEQALEELAVANSKLVEQSTIDGLTGAYNRRYFDEALEREWSRAARNGLHLALALVDLDRFKEINDQYGHPRGDDCLLCVATVLQGRLRRPGDVVARYGGDEFAVILPNTSESGAREALEDIRSVVENLSNAPAPGLTCSIGVASCIPKRGHSPEALLHMADERLYAAKVAGRNRVSASAADAAEVA